MCPKEDQKEGRVDSKEGKTLSFLEKKRRSSPTQQIGSDKQFYLVCELLFQGFEWKLAFFFWNMSWKCFLSPFWWIWKQLVSEVCSTWFFLTVNSFPLFFFLSLLVCIEARKTWWTMNNRLYFAVWSSVRQWTSVFTKYLSSPLLQWPCSFSKVIILQLDHALMSTLIKMSFLFLLIFLPLFFSFAHVLLENLSQICFISFTPPTNHQ